MPVCVRETERVCEKSEREFHVCVCACKDREREEGQCEIWDTQHWLDIPFFGWGKGKFGTPFLGGNKTIFWVEKYSLGLMYIVCDS